MLSPLILAAIILLLVASGECDPAGAGCRRGPSAGTVGAVRSRAEEQASAPAVTAALAHPIG